MRTHSNTLRPLAAGLALAVLTAGCDRLQLPGTKTEDPAARSVITKDSNGQRVRLDPVTGNVTKVDGTKTPAPAAQPAGRSAAARSAVRPVRRRSAANEAPASPRPLPAPAIVPPKPRAVAVAFRPAPPPITFGELCGSPGERIGITLVDTGLYARPSLGTPILTRMVSGALVTVVGDAGEWLHVTVDGAKGPLSGFVFCTALRPLTPAATTDVDSGTPDAP